MRKKKARKAGQVNVTNLNILVATHCCVLRRYNSNGKQVVQEMINELILFCG